MSTKKRMDTFILNAQSVHGDRYDYSKVEYVNAHTPVIILCPEHGEFEQKPVVHYNHKCGCPKCHGGTSSTTEQFITKARSVHGDDFDYELVDYKNQYTHVSIKCNTCQNTFSQLPKKHLAGNGCNKCHSGAESLTTETFIDKAKSVHGDQYDYSLVDYKNNKTEVTIICPDHGEFSQRPMNHINQNSQGCPSCGRNNSIKNRTNDAVDMLQLVKTEQHPNIGYEEFQYTGYHNSITLICPDHGPFQKTYWNALQGQGCPQCSSVNNIQSSPAEKSFLDEIEKHCGTVQRNVRTVISPYELDGYFPEHNIAIEYCGLYWHGELQGKSRNYHRDKMLLCKEQGIKLITVFEDEWLTQPNVVLARIIHACGKSKQSIYARKCTVRTIDLTTAKNFLNTHHLQGYVGCRYRYGLFYEDQLVSVMTFAVPNRAKGHRTTDGDIYEISRWASSTNVVGGGSKLIRAFENAHKVQELFTYADLRWGDGYGYVAMGFTHVHNSKPNYWYFKSRKRIHRFALRKNETDNPELTEWENRKEQGWDRIWDCGHGKFVKTYQ